MGMGMSCFASTADYFQARAEVAERLLAQVARELGCNCDAGQIMAALADQGRDIEEDFAQGFIAAGGTQDDAREKGATYRKSLRPQATTGGAETGNAPGAVLSDGEANMKGPGQ